MILKSIKSFFSRDSKKNIESSNTEELIALLHNITNGLGDYASYAFKEDDLQKKMKKGQEMLAIISDTEGKCNTLNNSDLSYLLAIAYRNYCALFVRGDERKKYLEKCILFLNKTISISPNHINAKSELGRLLIEEKTIRNIPNGIKLLEELSSDGTMPSYLNSVLARAHRQSGNIEINQYYNLCKFTDPSPAVFREERKRFRTLIREYKKQNEIDKLKITLDQYYKLAVLVTICYGDNDCNSGVIGWQYDDAVNKVKKICKKINHSFEAHGYIENSNFISHNDWKIYVKIFGENDKKFDPIKQLR
jgi:hypothetical protein